MIISLHFVGHKIYIKIVILKKKKIKRHVGKTPEFPATYPAPDYNFLTFLNSKALIVSFRNEYRNECLNFISYNNAWMQMFNFVA